MIGGARPLGNVECSQSQRVGSSSRYNHHSRISAAFQHLTRSPQQTYKPEVGLNRNDFSVLARSVRTRESEQSDIGSHVPHNITRLHQFIDHLEEDFVTRSQVSPVEAQPGIG